MRTSLWILIVILLLAKVAAVVMRGPSILVWDSATYWELGGLVQNGDWFLMQRPIAYRTPVYPWLVGLLRSAISRPLLGLIVVQAVLWIASVGVAASLASQLSQQRRSAMIAIGLAVIPVSSVVYATTVLSETLFVFLLMLHLFSVIRFARNPTWGWAVLSGVLLGATIMTRPIALLLWGINGLLVLAYVPAPKPFLRKAVLVGVSLLATFLCVTPWLARNHKMFGEVMLTEFVGRNIWIVTFQPGSGAGLELPPTSATEEFRERVGDDLWSALMAKNQWQNTWTVSKALTGAGLTDPQADRLMKRIALDAIKRSPMAFGKKALRRSINFWRTRATEIPPQVADLDDTVDTEAAYAGNPIWGQSVPPVDWLLRHRFSNWLFGNTMLLGVMLVGFIVLLRLGPSPRETLWLGVVLAYFCLITSILEIPAYRYRMILEPIVLAIIAAAAGHLSVHAQRFMPRRLPQLRPPGASQSA